MKSTKNRFFLLFAALFLALTLACWFHSPRAESLTERRKLAQKPELTLKSFTGGSFASSFESYSQDQFPLREGFRTLLCSRRRSWAVRITTTSTSKTAGWPSWSTRRTSPRQITPPPGSSRCMTGTYPAAAGYICP